MTTHEERQYTSQPMGARADRQGRLTQLRKLIVCPFCEADVVAYVWSLSGNGKKCPCGAMFTSFGTARKKVQQ